MSPFCRFLHLCGLLYKSSSDTFDTASGFNGVTFVSPDGATDCVFWMSMSVGAVTVRVCVTSSGDTVVAGMSCRLMLVPAARLG